MRTLKFSIGALIILFQKYFENRLYYIFEGNLNYKQCILVS